MTYYELTYLTNQEMSEEAAKSLQDKYAAFITARLGAVIDSPKAYKRRLAYPVKKQEVALVNSIRFQMEPAAQLELKDEVYKDTLVLRSLIVSYVPQPIRQIPERVEVQTLETAEAKAQEPVATLETTLQIAEEKKEEKKEEEKTEAKEIKETKVVGKPKARREKVKADLKEIGEKLDEILK